MMCEREGTEIMKSFSEDYYSPKIINIWAQVVSCESCPSYLLLARPVSNQSVDKVFAAEAMYAVVCCSQ